MSRRALSPAAAASALLALTLSLSGCAGLFQRAEAADASQGADAAQAARERASAAQREAAFKPQSAQADVQLPTPTRLTLSNGLNVLVLERHNLPIVSVRALVRTGTAQDPKDLAGLADLTAELLDRGSPKRSAEAIAEAIDFVGGSLTTGAGLDASAVSLSVLKKDLGVGLELLADALLHPTFPEAELKRAKEEAQAQLTSLLDDANDVTRLGFSQTVYHGHPYGLSPTRSSLAKIGRRDVEGFYRRHYRPNNTFLVVVGDVTPGEVRSKFETALGRWAAAPVAQKPLPAPAAASGQQVRLIDMPVNQSFIRFGSLGVERNNPDYFPLTVMNFILGGDFTSRLNQSIRDRQGLAYGASSGFGMNLAGGTFVASLNTKAESTAQALNSLLVELKRMQDEPVSPQELKFAQDYLTGSFPLRFETNANLADEVANIELYHLPADYLQTYRARVRAVTPADVQRVARAYLPTSQYTLVVTGKASAVAPHLKGFGPVVPLDKASLVR